MAKIGLLILTSPFAKLKQRIPHVLTSATSHVQDTLYVHLQPEPSASVSDAGTNSTNTCHFSLRAVPLTNEAVNLVQDFYKVNSQVCQDMDIRVLQSHFTNGKLKVPGYSLSKSYDIILHDFQRLDSEKDADLISDICKCFQSHEANKKVLNIEKLQISPSDAPTTANNENSPDTNKLDVKRHVVLGGTFDRLHIGHKILLSQACFLATDSLTVGISDTPLIENKVLFSLIEPLERRMDVVRDFVCDIKPELFYDIIPLLDIYGPTVTDPKLDCLVVSEETKSSGDKINKEREKKGMKPMEINVVQLLEDSKTTMYEEDKMSSSNQRMRLLGTLIRDPEPSKSLIPLRPYRIGLTGAIGSGKSSVCERLEKLGAAIIDCDKLGHKVYLKGTPVFHELVKTFGERIIGSGGQISRTVLGKIVFSDSNLLEKLNGIVWPAITKLVEVEIQEFAQKGKDVVVIEAAVLLEANWSAIVHEVWVTSIPKKESKKRIMERNELTEEEADMRISNQMPSSERVAAANVVLSTFWDFDETQRQVEKAWSLLKKRI